MGSDWSESIKCRFLTRHPSKFLFWEALALIVAACVFAPLFRALKLGTILGYLAAGLAVQVTLSLSFSAHPEDLLHFAEFGVVLFLFVIGLELKPAALWDMRRDIFGLGLFQMLGCGAVLAVPALLLGFSVPVAIAIGLGLALSSTALVMQLLEERGDRATTYGRKSFSILLFQDLAIVPLLMLVAFLAPASTELGFQEGLTRLVFCFPRNWRSHRDRTISAQPDVSTACGNRHAGDHDRRWRSALSLWPRY